MFHFVLRSCSMATKLCHNRCGHVISIAAVEIGNQLYQLPRNNEIYFRFQNSRNLLIKEANFRFNKYPEFAKTQDLSFLPVPNSKNSSE